MEGVALNIFWAVVNALSPVIGGAIATLLVALIGWVFRKFKISFSAERRARYDAVVSKHVKKTFQTYVQALKDKADDGKLTGDEAKEALARTVDGIGNDLTGWYRKTVSEIKDDVEAFIGGLKIAAGLTKGGTDGNGNP